MSPRTAGVWIGFVLLVAQARANQAEGLRLSLKLQRGQTITGKLGDYDDQRLVLSVQDRPVAVAWDDLEASSAYQAKKKILERIRGSAENLTAEDHFRLGYFLARRHRHAAAVAEFRKAQQRDVSYKERVAEAWREIRSARERHAKIQQNPFSQPRSQRPQDPKGPSARRNRPFKQFSQDQHLGALKRFKEFGNHVRETLAPDLVLLETRHFLVWTDWPEDSRNLIPDWAEALYRVMCDEFGFSADEQIWLGKCPLFCFAQKPRFDQFAKTFDGYDSTDVLGYTKTVQNGYVHVVLRRLGNQPSDLDRFATTMVHESSHAFLHCYRSSSQIPPWINEGLADYIAERVLDERCQTGENALAVARQYVYHNKPIRELFESTTSPPAHYYPIAHSLVEYLIHRDRKAFRNMIDDLKAGLRVDQALAKNYKGLTTNMLERSWRAAILRNHPPR